MVETPVARPLRVFFLALASVSLFSVMNVFVKLASEAHSVVEVMFFRNSLAIVPVALMIALHPKRFDLLKTRRPMGHLARGVVGTAGMVFFFLSFAMLPLADATAIHFASPIILAALSGPVLGEKVGPWRWGAVIAGFVGVLVITAPTGDTDMLGSLIALMAAFTSACVVMILRRLGKTEHALTIVFYFFLSGSVLTALFLPWYWTPPSLSSFAYLVLCGLTGGGAQVFLTKSYAEAPAAFVAPFNYISIIFAAFFGWAIWGDIPKTQIVIGVAIVIASGLFILYRETAGKKPEPLPPTLEEEPTERDLEEALDNKSRQ